MVRLNIIGYKKTVLKCVPFFYNLKQGVKLQVFYGNFFEYL